VKKNHALFPLQKLEKVTKNLQSTKVIIIIIKNPKPPSPLSSNKNALFTLETQLHLISHPLPFFSSIKLNSTLAH
jgi:hypothetical protein